MNWYSGLVTDYVKPIVIYYVLSFAKELGGREKKMLINFYPYP
jgi:hypothetical protein